MSHVSLNQGDVVRLRWPYTDLEGAKTRPALILSAPNARGDCELAMITKNVEDPSAIVITAEHYASESQLPLPSAVRTDRRMLIAADVLEKLTVALNPSFVAQVKKAIILKQTRDFSKQAHSQNRPGNDPQHPHNQQPTTTNNLAPAVPYAGRVFNEDEVEAAVSATLDFWLTLGEHGEAMQEELAAVLGVKKCLLVNSGSSANLIAVAALTTHKLPPHKRIQKGDEVITCAAGFPTTVAPIIQNVAVPVFIDNDPTTGNARMDQLEAAYVPGKTKAVMFAHTLGNPFDLATVCEFCHKHELWLIEDNCDALGCTYTLPVEKAKAIGLQHLIKIAEKGDHPIIIISEQEAVSGQQSAANHASSALLTAPTGAFGDISTQSFYPPHHLTMGEGGSVNIIRRASLSTYAESFRDWGRDCWCPSGKDDTCGKRFQWQLGELPEGYDHKYIYSHLGYNVKPLDPQAAIGRQQIKKLPAFIQARKDNWDYLRKGLVGLEEFFQFSLPTHATGWSTEFGFTWDASGCQTDCSWFGFMLLVKPNAPFKKSAFASYLDENKVGNRMLFGGNLLRQPAFVQLKKDNPQALRVTGEMPGADRIMNEAIFIGTYPGLTKLQLDHMVKTIREFVESQKSS
ncbi:MAG: lipopolysaccharide biosynthesis protein RfbH [Opitutales bacterium]